MNTEVNLQDIVILQDHFFLPQIWSIVGTDVIQAQPGWKTQATFQTVPWHYPLVTNQSSDAVLNPLGDLSWRFAWLNDIFSSPLTDLAVSLGSLTIVIEEGRVHAVVGTDFLASYMDKILIVNLNFALWILSG